MRFSSAALRLLLVLLLAACQQAAHHPAGEDLDTEHELERIHELLARSESIFVAGDYDAALTLFDKDFVALWPGMDPVTGEEAIRTHYKENVFDRWNYLSHTHDTRQVEVAGRWAFWWGYGEGIIQPRSGGDPESFRVKGVMIMRKQDDGSWKYSHSIFN